MKATSHKYLKNRTHLQIIQGSECKCYESYFEGLSYLQHPFLHPKQKVVDKQIEILRNLFVELLDHLEMPQTKVLLHVIMLSLLIMTYNLQCLSPLFFFF